jgi:hypothetical protein
LERDVAVKVLSTAGTRPRVSGRQSNSGRKPAARMARKRPNQPGDRACLGGTGALTADRNALESPPPGLGMFEATGR